MPRVPLPVYELRKKARWYDLIVQQPDPSELVPPRLPVRASIYIAPDGTVHFGALFAELVPVAAALSTPTPTPTSTSTSTSTSTG
jgi:hypothetical protein